jgi:DNA-3-methyladenine glycosylase II
MTESPRVPDYWKEATQTLAASDPVLAALIPVHRPLLVGARGDAFQTLARAIVGQQISVRAAQSVWERFVASVGVMQPRRVLRTEVETLRKAGLSQRKAEYVRDLAQHFASGAIDVSSWPDTEDEAIIEQLVEVRGIGRWTAEIYLIFHLGRPNVLPLADLGVQRGLSVNYNRGKPLSARKLNSIVRKWEPWRSVGTWYMWRSLEKLPDSRPAEGSEAKAS